MNIVNEPLTTNWGTSGKGAMWAVTRQMDDLDGNDMQMTTLILG